MQEGLGEETDSSSPCTTLWMFEVISGGPRKEREIVVASTVIAVLTIVVDGMVAS